MKQWYALYVLLCSYGWHATFTIAMDPKLYDPMELAEYIIHIASQLY